MTKNTQPCVSKPGIWVQTHIIGVISRLEVNDHYHSATHAFSNFFSSDIVQRTIQAIVYY
jgi:hypothetical protein